MLYIKLRARQIADVFCGEVCAIARKTSNRACRLRIFFFILTSEAARLLPLSVKKAQGVGFRNSAHIYITRTQKRLVCVPHIQLQPRQVALAFCVEACVCVPQYVLYPFAPEARSVADFPPLLLPVFRAN